MHITCSHGIVKDFTTMKRGEYVDMIIHPCISPLPQYVEARRKFLLYDNACQARKFTERRYPHKVRNRSLRKLSIVLAYYGLEKYLKRIELFLVAKNLKIRMFCLKRILVNITEYSTITSVSFPILAPHPHHTYCRV